MIKSFLQISLAFVALLTLCLFSCNSKKMQTAKKDVANKKLDIYILMGQSNMSGRGYLIAEDSIVENQRVLMFTKDLRWVPAKNPLHFDKPGIAAVGPGLSFGLAMQAADKSKTIALVPTAVGGTSINSWIPGGKDKVTGKYPWDDAERRVLEAMKFGTVKGVLWHQGESDSKTENAVVYLPKLEALIKRVRTLVGNDKLPFIVGQLGRYNPQYDNINRETANLPEIVPYTAIASSEGLVDRGDNTHFTRSSAIVLGQRFAKKMLEVQKKE
ncbi:sialate O-acetylesterase [Pedobacter sp. SD-b]|uniref:Sialate O-acetylesterase n=1 Tax=Pedobacter segetis TaxID=2793069 RepID=A0ABS1BKQ2_9SPHI|nr:sialate O-acetylesterase [Pedobacter segetis]MBK0382901.1 sialate O-acetylesterase [Pedobacter segetis]